MHTFRVWAPLPKTVQVQVGDSRGRTIGSFSMTKDRFLTRVPPGNQMMCTFSSVWLIMALALGQMPVGKSTAVVYQVSASRRSRQGLTIVSAVPVISVSPMLGSIHALGGASFCRHRHGHLLGDWPPPGLPRTDFRELRTEEQDLRRVEDPDENDDERACGAIGRGRGTPTEIESDQCFAEREEKEVTPAPSQTSRHETLTSGRNL